jgi:ribosomal protein S18 acetylase RimI-like enzyme
MRFIDKAFARRLESAEEIPQVDCARMLQKLCPRIGGDFAPICGGHMMFAGLNSPIGHAAGLGFDGPMTAADLDCLEAFYRSHNAPAQLDLCPLTDPSVLELTSARGYGILELKNVLFRPIDSKEEVVMPKGIEIRRSSPAEAATFSDLLTQCFFEQQKPPADFADLLAPLFHFPECLTFLATAEGVPIGAAAGRIIPEHRIFALFGAGTLPEFRGRGIQTAFLRARMKAAGEAGCEFAVVVTKGGTTSERNCVRLGFRIAYSKATVIKRWNE